MTTPDPSRSVSPEPTKGERIGIARRALQALYEDDQLDDRLVNEVLITFERAIQSAYIPLVEAARAMIGKYPLNSGDPYVEAIEAALVQVPGQQQAEPEAGNG